MANRGSLQTGDVHWLDDCPPLDGREEKRRPVIIVDPQTALDAGADPVLVVAVTTAECDDHDRLRLPSEQENPQTLTGLPKPCFALPRWILPVERRRLTQRIGKIPGVLLAVLMEAVELRLHEPDGWDNRDAGGPSDAGKP